MERTKKQDEMRQAGQAEIAKMLAMFERIREVDTEGVEPMHTLPYEGTFSAEAAENVPERTVDVRKLDAPHMRGALFEVPYTLDLGPSKNSKGGAGEDA